MDSVCPRCHTISELLSTQASATKSRDALLESARVKELVASNTVPLDSEIPPLEEQLRSSRQRMHMLEDAIASLQATLDRLKDDHERVTRAVQNLTTILHPSRKLPHDILCEVFLYSDLVQIDPLREEDIGINFTKSPWPLAWTCRHWRHTAINLTKLWTNININLDKGNAKGHAQLLTEHLKYSRDALLIIRFKTQRDIKNPILIKTVLPTSQRWDSLILDMHHCTVKAFAPVEGLMPKLEVVAFCLQGQFTGPRCTIFKEAPRLRALKVFGMDQFYRHYDLPYTQLAEYSSLLMHDHINSDFDSECLSVIRASPNLQFCEALLHYNTHHPPNPVMTFNHLTELRLSQVTEGSLFQVLEDLTLPALDVLFLRSARPRDMGETEIESVLSLLDRSNCDLRNLELGSPLRSDDLIKLLEGCPSVLNLDLHGQSLTDEVLTEMTYHTGLERYLLPRLINLTIIVYGSGSTFDPDVKLFADMLESRVKFGVQWHVHEQMPSGPARLETLDLLNLRKKNIVVKPELRSRFDALQELVIRA